MNRTSLARKIAPRTWRAGGVCSFFSRSIFTDELVVTPILQFFVFLSLSLVNVAYVSRSSIREISFVLISPCLTLNTHAGWTRQFVYTLVYWGRISLGASKRYGPFACSSVVRHDCFSYMEHQIKLLRHEIILRFHHWWLWNVTLFQQPD